MRIRKYAKVSSLQLLPGGSNSASHASGVDDGGGHLLKLLLQPHVCQLNQSPWDAPDSSPLPFQYQGEDSFTGTVNSLHDSAQMQESYPDELEPKEERQKEEKLVVKRKKVIGAGTTTRRKKTRKGGGSLGNYDNATVMKGGEAASTRRRKKKGATTNPYEFYYYTGFGPSWRKRGANGEDGQNGNFSSATDSISSITGPGPAAYTTPFLVNKFGITVNGDDGMDIVEEEEYEDDDGGVSSGCGGKKRMRKPVKARSLKSLM